MSIELRDKINCTASGKKVTKIEIQQTNILILVKVITELHLQVPLRRNLANSQCINTILRPEEFSRLLQLVTLREELPWLFVQPHTMNSTHNIIVLSLIIDHLHRIEIKTNVCHHKNQSDIIRNQSMLKPKSSTCTWWHSSKLWYYLDNPLAHIESMGLMVIEGFIG
jgi:hypothetical protein